MRIDKLPVDCCGCSACYAICPTQAIKMVPNEQGFLYPKIDDGKCVDCGRCAKVCSFKKDHAKAQKQTEPEYYAAIHKDAASRSASRSGGTFFAFAQTVLAEGGVVYGVVLTPELLASTVRIDDEKDLGRLQGSKYVQSDKNDSYRLAKKDLDEGRAVLFSGTGCEIGGLHSYLQATHTNTDRLITCDLICHGVQSPRVWEDNLKYLQKKMKKPIEAVSFRDKRFGWHPHIESYRAGGKTRYANRYTTLFYERVSIRPSCGICHFCSYDRSGDLTLADFWGVEQLGLPEDITKGVSLLMVHTENGKELLEKAKAQIKVYPVTKEQTRQKNLIAPSPLNSEHTRFWETYHKEGYKKTSDRFYKPYNRVQLLYNCLCRRNKK